MRSSWRSEHCGLDTHEGDTYTVHVHVHKPAISNTLANAPRSPTHQPYAQSFYNFPVSLKLLCSDTYHERSLRGLVEFVSLATVRWHVRWCSPHNGDLSPGNVSTGGRLPLSCACVAPNRAQEEKTVAPFAPKLYNMHFDSFLPQRYTPGDLLAHSRKRSVAAFKRWLIKSLCCFEKDVRLCKVEEESTEVEEESRNCS